MRRLVALLVLVVGLLFAGAVPAHAQARTNGNVCLRHQQHQPARCLGSGTLMGDVLAGPTCPVERADQPCPPRPVSGATVRIMRPNGSLAATATTDALGHFRATLPPGDYRVEASGSSGFLMRQAWSEPVHITAGHVSHVRIMLDTGIR